MHCYQPDLALIHDRGYGRYADHCAPGILELLAPVRDILDLDYGVIRAGERPIARVEADWAIITEFSAPAPDRFVRDATTFVPDGAGAWRRGHERHENVLVDTSARPALLAEHGVRAEVGTAFGPADLPPSLPACVRSPAANNNAERGGVLVVLNARGATGPDVTWPGGVDGTSGGIEAAQRHIDSERCRTTPNDASDEFRGLTASVGHGRYESCGDV